MKIIIVAGGEGTRLRPYTEKVPKCMVELYGKPLIDNIIKSIKNAGFTNIAVVTGYKSDVLKEHLKDENIDFFHNPEYDTTNMVETFFCAEDFMDDDLIISYSDILYNSDVIKKLAQTEGELCITVDKEWQKLWEFRMENALLDAETMKIEDGKIVELGKKPKSLDEIQGQYIGLVRFSKDIITKAKTFYKSKLAESEKAKKMYMTDLLQGLIDDGVSAVPSFINGGWLEVDTVEDLERYKSCEWVKKSIFG